MQKCLSSTSMLVHQPQVFFCSVLCCWHRYVYTALMMCLAGFGLLSFLWPLNRLSGSMAWKQCEKITAKPNQIVGGEGLYKYSASYQELLTCILKAWGYEYIHVSSLHSAFKFLPRRKFFFWWSAICRCLMKWTPGSDLHNKELFSLIADSGYHQHCVSTDA